jgi:hypothetical protein
LPLKNPDAVAAVVSALRHVHGDEAARIMLAEGVTLAKVLKAMFSAPIAHRDAVRFIADSFEDFILSPDPGPLRHVKYVYEVTLRLPA